MRHADSTGAEWLGTDWPVHVQGDFATNLKMLQRYPPMDAHTILHCAEQLGTQPTTTSF